jgi:LPXTG-motif cell wall-anchored protein
VIGAFMVRKVLDASDVQGTRDMSGFEFEATTADGTSIGRATTGADGRTPSFEAVGGTYTITEVAVPTWATGVADGGPVTFEFEPDGDSDGADAELVISYTNVVPHVSVATAARDAGDGDQVVDLAAGDATIIDTVSYRSLVPGTEYIATGELMVAGAEMIASGITASTTFVPHEPDGSVDVVFSVPSDSPLLGHVVVVYQQLSVAGSGRVVATHADPDAAEQTIEFADITTTTTTTIPTTVPDTLPAPTITEPSPTTSTVAVTTTAPPPTSSPPAPPTAPPPAEPQLPRTGTDGSGALAVAGGAIMLAGVGLALVARLPRRRSAIGWNSRR